MHPIDYHAYGSNMHLTHLQEWIAQFGVPAENVCNPRLAILPGFRFRTNYLTTASLGAANIEPCRDEQVEGVLLRVSPNAVEALRRKEGHPHRYKEVAVNVVLQPCGREVQAFTYIVAPRHRLPFDVPVSARYRDLVLTGAGQAGLSPVYRSHLAAILQVPRRKNDACEHRRVAT